MIKTCFYHTFRITVNEKHIKPHGLICFSCPEYASKLGPAVAVAT
jgi:hypothetical protein